MKKGTGYSRRIWQPVRSTVKDTRKSALGLRRRDVVLAGNGYFAAMKPITCWLQCAPNQWFQSSRTYGKIGTEHPTGWWVRMGNSSGHDQNGLCWFFGTDRPLNAKFLGWHTSIIGDRIACARTVHQAFSRSMVP